MSVLLVFGPGYTASRIADRLAGDGWHIERAGRALMADPAAMAPLIASATHILSSVPPVAGGGDPVLAGYGGAIAAAPARWIGYLSSTGVYGDTGGAWVDEAAPLLGRRADRIAADRAWLSLGARVFRLPGIYGPGRSALDRVAAGQAHRVDLPDQVFSRIHVDDIASAVIASLSRGPAGAYNIADALPAPQNSVIDTACAILGIRPPPLLSLEEANLSPMARAFYAENRRVANGRARRLLHWQPAYPDWRAGLAAIAGRRAR